MRNIALTLSYDGSEYHGWQCQPGVVTIEEVMRDKVSAIVDHGVKLYSGGRTDKGVHAFGQVANFYTEKGIPLVNLERGLNSMLPGDIRVVSARDMEAGFHARYSAKRKTYLYCIRNAAHNSPFFRRYVWHIHYPLDDGAMRDTLRLVEGSHDFSAFKKKDEPYATAVRTVLRTGLKRRGDLILVLIEADGFLRYMVRNIVGTVVLAGAGKLTADRFVEIMASGDRDMAGPTAPPQGLFLRKILY